MLSKPDILLLDEPTNHLDIETIEWLEQYLKNYSKSVVIVSHDRMFLNKIVNKVYEIEYGVTTAYSGNYTFFEEQKKINYEKQLKDYEYQQKEIKRLNDIVTRFKYKPTKAKMAMSKLKQIERMVKIEAPNKYDLTTFKTNFIIEKQSGKDVLFAKDLEIGYDKTLQKISLNVYRGQKIGIIGENGIGKSTLLKTLVGIIPKISGEFEFGHNVQIGYFDQQMALLDSRFQRRISKSNNNRAKKLPSSIHVLRRRRIQKNKHALRRRKSTIATMQNTKKRTKPTNTRRTNKSHGHNRKRKSRATTKRIYRNNNFRITRQILRK